MASLISDRSTYQSGVREQIQGDLGTTETLATLGTGLYNLVS